MSNFFYSLRNPRLLAAFFYDFHTFVVTFWLAIYLRFDSFTPINFEFQNTKTHFFISLICLIISCFANGLYLGLWRFSSLFDLLRVIRASAIGVLSGLVLNFFFSLSLPLPRSVYLIHFILLVMTLGGGRFVYRFWKDHLRTQKSLGLSRKKVLIVGAGVGGARIIREIQMDMNLDLKVVGLIDDDPFKKFKKVHEIRVLGAIKDIPELVQKNSIDKIFVAIPSANNNEIKNILEICEGLNVELKVLPKIDQLLASQSGLSLLRNIRIEDLLGREQVNLDQDSLTEMLRGKKVLVSGAGGSIGSELCFQIAKFSPKEIIFFDISEYFLFELEHNFKDRFPGVEFQAIVGDVRNINKIEKVFQKNQPEFVFHAAAYKHVPMMEFNPEEAIETNIRGTKQLAEVALKYKAEKFILISTDKAVNPTNIMGATKRIAEMIVCDLFEKNKSTKFISVRFGNVLGSNGSVIPLFKKQIEERQSLTITDPDITRFFMSIPEAAQLVLQAGSLGAGGEIFVLDMGSPVKIVDLAKTMIRLAGLKIGKDIDLKFIGLRPGEKMYEELFSTEEEMQPTDHLKIMKAKTRKNSQDFSEQLSELFRTLPEASNGQILKRIKIIMPEFNHKNLYNENLEGIMES